ncbi:gamma-glutamylcyclotransferase family protein [Aneurinibacillus tyrosinisolvens]|uniref:gamma-glutamylcyclotransferase family protein n=1 Tax=Aneurinibacillus tyrosinisolvens TaxID=1443435 RepID=UPI00069C0BF9|nr:gamma-glutamylcyclotransferase [Aneurinibacillus tyrosinisolvens]
MLNPFLSRHRKGGRRWTPGIIVFLQGFAFPITRTATIYSSGIRHNFQYIAHVYVANQSILLGREIESGDWKLNQFLQKNLVFLLYYAYGSCMDDARFKQSGVKHYFSTIYGIDVLDGFALKYTRKTENDGSRADVVEQEKERVEGVVYEVPTKALEYLFEREGFPNA